MNNAELLKLFQQGQKGSYDSDDSEEQVQDRGIVITEALLNFVDLAGSEKVSNHYQGYKLDQLPNALEHNV